MDSWEFNKLAAAFLLCLLVTLGVANLAGAIVAPKQLAETAYKVPGVEEAAAPAAAAAAAEPAQPIGVMLASASVEAGERAARKCVSCHTFEQGGPSRIGPNLHGIVGADKAHIDGFAYSAALAGMAGNWGYEELDKFIAAPASYVRGTKMSFAGIKNAKERADLIAYMRSISPNAPPLPQ